MRVIFLGTSHGYPEGNRRCSSTLIEVNGSRYFIDMGADVSCDIINRGIPSESVKAVFITHMHGDHTNGLIHFLDLATWAAPFKNADPEIFIPGSCDKFSSAISAWREAHGAHLNREYKFIEVNEGVVYEDENIKVTAFRTKHCEISYAYLVEAEGKSVLFSGDLSRKPSDDFPYAALDMPLEFAVLEVAHFPATEYIPILNGRNNPKKVYFNHYSRRNIESIGTAIKELDMPVILATDGLETTI